MLDKIYSFRLSVCFLESLINFINGLGIKTMVGILYIWYGGIAESRQGTFTMLFVLMNFGVHLLNYCIMPDGSAGE